MTIGINTSPLAGRSGDKLTARLLRSRLDQELVGNVSIGVQPTERPDTWEVQGRGELQLAVLVETLRREGFELTVGKPQVLTREADGDLYEPVERLAIDIPEDFLGVTTQLLALRKGRLDEMVNHGTGWVRLEYLVPARGLIGFRTEFMTETRGAGVLHSVFERYEPWHGEIKTRPTGALVPGRANTPRDVVSPLSGVGFGRPCSRELGRGTPGDAQRPDRTHKPHHGSPAARKPRRQARTVCPAPQLLLMRLRPCVHGVLIHGGPFPWCGPPGWPAESITLRADTRAYHVI